MNTCPECNSPLHPGRVDGVRYEQVCLQHGPVGLAIGFTQAGTGVQKASSPLPGRRGQIPLPAKPVAIQPSLTIDLPYPPTLNHMYATVNGRRVLSAAGKTFKAEVGWAAKEAGLRITPGPIAVTIVAYRPRKCGDIDNIFKAVLDGITGVGWVDDSQVKELHAYLRDDKQNPRVELTITAKEIA